jgi:separase
MVECARVAFAAMRSLQSSGKISLPELQLEAGMSSLVGKLISLGLYEHAIKELRVLKSRLERDSTKKEAESKTQAQLIADMLSFHGVKPGEPMFSLAVTSQVQLLRIMSEMKRPAVVEACLSILSPSHQSSPTSHLTAMSKVNNSDASKISRQMQTVSQLLLSLTPSVSSQDDVLALDSKLSVSPLTSLELQVAGLQTRLHWWKLAGHKGDVDKDVLYPLSKCFAAYARRKRESRSVYEHCLNAFNRVDQQIQATQLHPSSVSRSPLGAIFQQLVSLARETGRPEDAISWAAKLRDLLNTDVESVGKMCSVSAQLLALQLKHDPFTYLQETTLLDQVVQGIQGQLRGDSTELDELLNNVNSVRRAAMATLMQHSTDTKAKKYQPPPAVKESLSAIVLQCPRFCLRWLGKPLDPKSSTKDYLRYEQRRQLLSQSIHHMLDAAFMLAKKQLDDKSLGWESLETMLSDCQTLLEYIGDVNQPDDGTTYHVKISHFYYMKYNSLRQSCTDSKDSKALKALRRSIDCVRTRPAKEKEKAQLLMKLERMFELCKSQGRADEALQSLEHVKASLVEDGVLGTVADAFSTRPPHAAWNLDHKTELLSRTISNMYKMGNDLADWAHELPDTEHAAILEHDIRYVLLADGNQATMLTLEVPLVDALLRIYNPTRFPIRRLRTLILILFSTIGSTECCADILSVAADAVQLDEHDNLGDDTELAKYIPHLKTLYSAISQLIQGIPDHGAFKATLSTWKSMIGSKATQSDLEERIDGVAELLAHLQSITDFLRVKGLEDLLAAVLELSADICRVIDSPMTADFLSSHSALALQYVSMGQSTMAERTIQTAEDFYKKQSQVSGDITTHFQLDMADYLIATGSLMEA